jgi:hypothetical protein
MTDVPPISTSWDEGRYLDLWMLVHFGSGAAGGFSNVLFGLTAIQVFMLAIGLMLLWEMAELALDITESLSNRAIDIVVGLAGVWLALMIAQRLDPHVERIAFVTTLTLSLIGMGLGVRAAIRRKRTTTV